MLKFSHCSSGGGSGDDAEAALEAALLGLQASGEPSKEQELPWFQQLSTLVQAGVPMVLPPLPPLKRCLQSD